MKRMLFILGLALPVGAMASVPAPQNVSASTQPAARQPLFQVRYVLLPAPKEASDTPRIDYGDRSPAVTPLQLDRWSSRELEPFASNPNVEICRQWGCEIPGQP